MKNFFKRIWNYIERKFDSIWDAFTDESIIEAEENLKRLEVALASDKKPTAKICRYCLGEKQMMFKGIMTNCPECHGTGIDGFKPIIESKVIGQKVSAPIFYFPVHKMSFNKQQLVGKIITDGKDRFKIHELIAVGNKFKYYIEVLI